MSSAGLKTNQYVQVAIITGCLQITKNQIFTGLNNLEIYPVTRPLYASYFGFTQEETSSLLSYYGLKNKEDEVKTNDNGYYIENLSIYNPFSLLNFVKDVFVDKNTVCKNYWASSSGNALLWEMLESAKDNSKLKAAFEALLSGSSVPVLVDETINYDTMTENNAVIMGTLLVLWLPYSHRMP